jgi:hypothetical protein
MAKRNTLRATRSIRDIVKPPDFRSILLLSLPLTTGQTVQALVMLSPPIDSVK